MGGCTSVLQAGWLPCPVLSGTWRQQDPGPRRQPASEWGDERRLRHALVWAGGAGQGGAGRGTQGARPTAPRAALAWTGMSMMRVETPAREARKPSFRPTSTNTMASSTARGGGERRESKGGKRVSVDSNRMSAQKPPAQTRWPAVTERRPAEGRRPSENNQQVTPCMHVGWNVTKGSMHVSMLAPTPPPTHPGHR